MSIFAFERNCRNQNTANLAWLLMALRLTYHISTGYAVLVSTAMRLNLLGASWADTPPMDPKLLTAGRPLQIVYNICGPNYGVIFATCRNDRYWGIFWGKLSCVLFFLQDRFKAQATSLSFVHLRATSNQQQNRHFTNKACFWVMHRTQHLHQVSMLLACIARWKTCDIQHVCVCIVCVRVRLYVCVRERQCHTSLHGSWGDSHNHRGLQHGWIRYHENFLCHFPHNAHLTHEHRPTGTRKCI